MEFTDNKTDEQRLTDLNKEESHYQRLMRVFGTEEGLYVFEWLLELTGYWLSAPANERAQGRFEVGRLIFDQMCMADIETIHAILDRRRDIKERERQAERNEIINRIKSDES